LSVVQIHCDALAEQSALDALGDVAVISAAHPRTLDRLRKPVEPICFALLGALGYDFWRLQVSQVAP
jgi:hypothetical protein